MSLYSIFFFFLDLCSKLLNGLVGWLLVFIHTEMCKIVCKPWIICFAMFDNQQTLFDWKLFWICCCSWCFVHQSLRKFHPSVLCPLLRSCFKVVFSKAIISLQTEQKHRVYYPSSNPSTSNSHGLPWEEGSLVILVTPFPRIIWKKYSFPLAKLYSIHSSVIYHMK